MAILADSFYYQELRIDTINTRVFADLVAKEGDANGRGLLVTLTENGLMKDTTGITLILKWEHTSVGNQGLDNFEAVDPSKGLYKITYPTEMLNRGKVRAFIRIIDSGKLAGTRNIEITVDRGVGDDTAIASSDSFSTLASALIEVQSWNDRIDDVEQDFIDRANNLDATYPTRLVSVEQQLAEIATYSVDDIIADAGATYTGSGWTYTTGTDMSDIINSLIKTKNVVKLPKGNIYLTKPLILRSGTVLEGQVSANGKYLTRFIFNGALGDDCIKVDSSFEVSHYKIRFLRISDAREQMKGQAVAGGYGIFANNAVNSQLIEDCFIDGFGHGAIHVGSDSTARAGDNIVINRCWVSMGKVTKRAIAVGNFNNTCSISNIYCDGDGIVVDRYLGNYLSGVLHLNNIKHEHNADTSSPTIKTANNDQVYASNIIRRFSVANPIGCVIKPVSNRGVYLNCSGQYNYDGTGKGTRNIFKNTDDTVASVQDNYMGRTTFGEFIELKGNLQINSGAGTPEGVVTAKAGSLYFRTDGSMASAVYLKEQNSEGNTGWKGLQGIRSGITASRPTALGFTPPVGYQYFDTTLGKPIWLKTGTTWVDSTGATV